MLVKGFNKQIHVTSSQVVTQIKRIPTDHRKGVTAVVYDPSRFYQRSYVAPKSINYRAAAEYKNLPVDHILLYKFSSFEEFCHSLFHEFGHHVFYRILNSIQRKEWVTKVSPTGEYVTKYAQKNASEDFAESYAVSIKKCQKNQ